MNITEKVLSEISRERYRQEELRHAGKFPYTCATPNGLTDAEKLGVLGEEFGEVAQLVCHYKIPNEYRDVKTFQRFRAPSLDLVEHQLKEYRTKLREELIQVAAICLAWAETL